MYPWNKNYFLRPKLIDARPDQTFLPGIFCPLLKIDILRLTLHQIRSNVTKDDTSSYRLTFDEVLEKNLWLLDKNLLDMWIFCHEVMKTTTNFLMLCEYKVIDKVRDLNEGFWFNKVCFQQFVHLTSGVFCDCSDNIKREKYTVWVFFIKRIERVRFSVNFWKCFRNWVLQRDDWFRLKIEHVMYNVESVKVQICFWH